MIAEILAAALLGVYLPHETWINGDWVELRLRCEMDPVFMNTQPQSIPRLLEKLGTTQPQSISELLENLEKADCKDNTAKVLRDRIVDYLKDYRGFGGHLEARSDSIARMFLRPRVTTQVGGLDLVMGVALKVGETDEHPSHTWEGVIAADYDRVYLGGEWGDFSFLFGRESLRWGPSWTDPLLLSGNGPPFDMLMASYWREWLHFSSFFTILDPEGDISRYLSGHRIEVALFRGFSIGLTEIVLHGGRHTPPDPYYLNPLVLFYPREWNEARPKGNVLVGVDLSLCTRNWLTYGELMIDDYPYEETSRNDHPKLGWTVGMMFLDVLRDGGRTSVEYSGVHRWSYGHIIPWQEYSHRGFPIGHPLGSDFDRFLFRDVEHLGRAWDLEVSVSYTRKGEGRVSDPYPEDRFPEEYYLTGVVEKRMGIEIGIRRLLAQSSALQLTASWEEIANYQNMESVSHSQPSLIFKLDKNF